MHSMRRAGFTIVELLAVMVIVAILGAIALQSYKKVTYRARAATIVSDLGAIRTAAHQYQAEESVWPEDVDEGEGRVRVGESTVTGTFMRLGNRYTYFVESTFAPEEG